MNARLHQGSGSRERGEVSMRLAVVATAVLLSVCSCAFVTESPRFVPVPEPSSSYTDRVPAKVHLIDGSVVIFTTGISVRHDTLYPMVQPAVVPSTPVRQHRVRPSVKPVVRTIHGIRYDLTRQHRFVVDAVPTESVAGIEYYDRHTNVGSCLAWSPIWTSAIGGVGAFLLVGAILASAPW